MSPSTIEAKVPTVHTNGGGGGSSSNNTIPMLNAHITPDAATGLPEPPAFLSTRPPDDHHWRITLEGKIIAITGGNRGIGLGIAEVCIANGARRVYSLDVDGPGADFTTVQSKLGDGTRLQHVWCDVTSETSVTTALETIVTRCGALHGLVANAGTTKHQAALSFTRTQLDELFTLNVFGAYFCATAAARIFQRLGIAGSIVFTSSMTSYGPNRAAPSAPYGATKAAVRNMTRTMAMEWAASGVRVNSVSPGFVRTAMTTYYVDKNPSDWRDKMRYYGGMPRLAEPRELGGAYVYLLSEGASYTTGIDIPVAGVVGAW